MDISIKGYYILYFKNAHFISTRRACSLCLGSKRPMHLCVLDAITNTDPNRELLEIETNGLQPWLPFMKDKQFIGVKPYLGF